MLKLKPLVELIYGDQITGYYKPGTDCENNTPGVKVPQDPDIIHPSIVKPRPEGLEDNPDGIQKDNIDEIQDFIDRSSQNPASSTAGYQDEFIPPFQNQRPTELFMRELPAKKVGDFYKFLDGEVTVEMDDTGNRVIHLLNITSKSTLNKVTRVINILKNLADKVKVKLHMSSESDKVSNLLKSLGFKTLSSPNELIYIPKR